MVTLSTDMDPKIRPNAWFVNTAFSYEGDNQPGFTKALQEESHRIRTQAYDAMDRYCVPVHGGKVYLCPEEFMDALRADVEAVRERAEAFNAQAQAERSPQRCRIQIYPHRIPFDSAFFARLALTASANLRRLADALEESAQTKIAAARKLIRNLDMVLEPSRLRSETEDVIALVNNRRGKKRMTDEEMAPFVRALADRFEQEAGL